MQKLKPIVLLAFTLFVSAFVLSCQSPLELDVTPASENYIFGYGSLVNSESRAASLKKPVPAVPARVSAAFGYTRAWNFRAPSGFTCLGVRKALPGEAVAINGVVYPVDGDMDVWDKREGGYTRIEMPRSMISAVLPGSPLPERGTIWFYVPSDAALKAAEPDYPLLQSYIDVCMTGFLEHGPEYAIEFLETTQDWSSFWFNDRLLPRRPWVYQPNYGVIDNLLKKHPDGARNFFDARKDSLEYGKELPDLRNNSWLELVSL